jgi:hypothetical protein
MSGLRRVIVGASGSPGNLRALRYAKHLARATGATLIPAHAWIPPGGDVADRRCPSFYLRRGARRTRRNPYLPARAHCLRQRMAARLHRPQPSPRTVPDPPLQDFVRQAEICSLGDRMRDRSRGCWRAGHAKVPVVTMRRPPFGSPVPSRSPAPGCRPDRVILVRDRIAAAAGQPPMSR